MKRIIFGLAIVATGSFALAQKAPQTKAQMEAHRAEMMKKRDAKQQAHLDEMKKELDLTESQVAQFKAMQEKRKAERMTKMERSKEEMMANKERRKAEMQAKKKANEEEVRRILSPQQFEKWEANRKAKMMERREKFKKEGRDFKNKSRMEHQRRGSAVHSS